MFTLGDLITILIVFVVLLVYRQFDKNNRTLEKVKRFSDKAKDELDKIVQEKSTQLRDIGIEIDVHQKAAREILKRIKEIEDGLASRASDLEQIGIRIGEYDSVLDDLSKMTVNVEENITRLKDESEFVDTVGKRIKATAAQLEQVEKSIPALIEDFSGKNGEQLDKIAELGLSRIDESVRSFREEVRDASAQVEELKDIVRDTKEKTDSMLDEAETRLSGLASDILAEAMSEKTEALELLETGLSGFRQSIDRLEEDYSQRIDSVRKQGESLEHEALKNLTERMDADIDAANERAHARIQGIENGITASEASVIEKITMLEVKSSEDMENARERLKAAVEEGIRVQEDQLLQAFARFRDDAEKTRNEQESLLAGLNGRLDAWHEQMESRMNELFLKYQGTFDTSGRMETDIRGKLSELNREMGALEENLQSRMGALDGDLRSGMTVLEESIRTAILEAGKKGTELSDTMYRNILSEQDHIDQSLRSTIEERHSALKKIVESSEKDWAGQISGLREQLQTWKSNNVEILESYRQEIASELKQFKDSVEDRIDDGNEGLSRLSELTKKTESEIASLQSRLKTESEVFDQSLRASEVAFKVKLERSEAAFAESLAGSERIFIEKLKAADIEHLRKLESRSTEIEGRVLGGIETRLQDYETGFSYRFERIDAIRKDIDGLELRLKESVQAASTSAEADFEAFEQAMTGRRQAQARKTEEDFTALRNAMKELENGLAELKNRAYDNVSEKLKLFEDDFFSDLKTRSDAMDQKLLEWQNQVNGTVGSISQNYLKERENVEKAFKAEVKQKLAELQTRILQHLEHFEDQVKKYQEGMQSKISLSEKSFGTFQENLKVELAGLEKSTMDRSQEDLAQLGLRFAEIMRKHEKDVDVRLKTLKDQTESGCRGIEALLESSRSDVTVWQAKTLQQMGESEAEMGDRILALKTDSSQNISRIRETFAAEKEELVAGSEGERTRLHQELERLSAGIDALATDIRQRSAQTLDAFATESDTFLLDFQKKAKEIQVESDQRIREFREAVLETRETAESMQKKLYGKIDENARILSINLAEIDKKQKGFVEQTRIFERADSLKISLQESVEELRTQIQDLSVRHKDLKEMETQFLKIRKLAEDINAKTAKFTAEKRRIDLMEEDFQRLTSLTQTVDTRLGEVMAGSDALQAIQAKIRNLSDLQEDVESRFDRLEQKRNILDVTTEGVDKNFRLLDALEKDIRSMQAAVGAIPPRLEEVDGKLGELARNKEKVEEAIKQLKQLDCLLSDIENRTEQLQTAREWLARTETRIDEVRREAEQQVKLLGSILKEDRKGSSKEKGAPPLGVRETVVKLAHQGWSIEEIAKVTQISRGEVELILEIAPNK